jgi:hypothetical protein
MSRQIGLYRKVADDYDRMALLVNDRRLRNMFLGFAQQWREAALEADALGMLDQLKPMEENDHVSLSLPGNPGAFISGNF